MCCRCGGIDLCAAAAPLKQKLSPQLFTHLGDASDRKATMGSPSQEMSMAKMGQKSGISELGNRMLAGYAKAHAMTNTSTRMATPWP